jgi:hypothetical protein
VARSSWTRRLDDRVLGSTGVLIVLALACGYFLVSTISTASDGAVVAALVYGVLTVLSAQAVQTQRRSRKRAQQRHSQ